MQAFLITCKKVLEARWKPTRMRKAKGSRTADDLMSCKYFYLQSRKGEWDYHRSRIMTSFSFNYKNWKKLRWIRPCLSDPGFCKFGLWSLITFCRHKVRSRRARADGCRATPRPSRCRPLSSYLTWHLPCPRALCALHFARYIWYNRDDHEKCCWRGEKKKGLKCFSFCHVPIADCWLDFRFSKTNLVRLDPMMMLICLFCSKGKLNLNFFSFATNPGFYRKQLITKHPFVRLR